MLTCQKIKFWIIIEVIWWTYLYYLLFALQSLYLLVTFLFCIHSFYNAGAFVGCSLEGSVVTTRVKENSRFYGSQSLNASDILLGSLPKPPAAATLYRALADLYQKLDVWLLLLKLKSSFELLRGAGMGSINPQTVITLFIHSFYSMVFGTYFM